MGMGNGMGDGCVCVSVNVYYTGINIKPIQSQAHLPLADVLKYSQFKKNPSPDPSFKDGGIQKGSQYLRFQMHEWGNPLLEKV